MKAATVLGLLVGLVIAAGLLWIGGELRYQSCVDGARAADASRPVGRPSEILQDIQGKSKLAADLKDCSRLPF